MAKQKNGAAKKTKVERHLFEVEISPYASFHVLAKDAREAMDKAEAHVRTLAQQWAKDTGHEMPEELPAAHAVKFVASSSGIIL